MGEVTPAQFGTDSSPLCCQPTMALTWQEEAVAKLLNDIYAPENESFLIGLLDAISKDDVSIDDVIGYISNHGNDVGKITLEAAQATVDPGPHFSLRLAGGVYRFADNNLGLSELFVNSSTQTVYLDGELVSNLQIQNGDVTFATPNGMTFTIKFQCGQLYGDARPEILFKGRTSTIDAQDIPIMGTMYFPWGKSSDKVVVDENGIAKEDIPPPVPRIAKAKILAAASIRENAAASSLAVCMSLVLGHSDARLPGMAATEDSTFQVAAFKTKGVYFAGFGMGELYMAGGMLCFVLCTALVAYMKEEDPKEKLDSAMDQVLKYSVPLLMAVAIAVVHQNIIPRNASEMKLFIRQYGAKGDLEEKKEGEEDEVKLMIESAVETWDVISKTVKEEVNRLTPEDLKEDNKTHLSSIKKRLFDACTKKVRADVGLTTFKKFRFLRLYKGAEYQKVFDEATSAKVKEEVSEGAVEKLINRRIDQRKATLISATLEDKIQKLASEKNTARLKKDEEIARVEAHVTIHIVAQLEEVKKIENAYKQDLQRMEEEERQANEKLKANIEKSPSDLAIKDAEQDIKREIQESRKNEMEIQENSRFR